MITIDTDDTHSSATYQQRLEASARWWAWLTIVLCVLPILGMLYTMFLALTMPRHWDGGGAMGLALMLIVIIPMTAIPGGIGSLIGIMRSLQAKNYSASSAYQVSLLLSVIAPSVVLLGYGICWAIMFQL
jgi:hypothetical protein